MLIKEHVMGGIWWNDGVRNQLLEAESVDWAPQVAPTLVRGKRDDLPVFDNAYSYSTDPTVCRQAQMIFVKAGCVVWLEWDGQTSARAGCTTDQGRFESEGDTPEHAFCLAALKARGIEV